MYSLKYKKVKNQTKGFTENKSIEQLLKSK